MNYPYAVAVVVVFCLLLAIVQRLFSELANGQLLGLAIYSFFITCFVLNVMAYVAAIETEKTFVDRASASASTSSSSPSQLANGERDAEHSRGRAPEELMELFQTTTATDQSYIGGQMELMLSSGF